MTYHYVLYKDDLVYYGAVFCGIHISCILELFLPKHPIDGHPGRGGITEFVCSQYEKSFDSLHDIIQIKIIFPYFLMDFIFTYFF